MSFNWNAQPNKPVHPALAQQEITLDEEAMESLQEDPVMDIFEEEEDNTHEVMSDANLRLEQGRLYQMVLQGDIFADTNADPKAIRNVQREIRKFVRERMETMLGIRQEQANQEPIVSSPFNDLEVTVLKMLASKMSKGQTEETSKPTPQAPTVPKKDGITSISGSLRPNQPTPLSQQPKAQSKPIAQKQPQKSAKPVTKPVAKVEESALTKPVDQMTPQELAEHDAKAQARSRQQYATLPTNMVPHPSPQALEAMYTGMASQLTIANPWRNGAV